MQQYFTILKNKYEQSAFQKFAHELLNEVEIGERQLPIDSVYANHIESFIYLGSFTDPQGKNLHVLDVALKTNTKIEQARTMQRNLIARYLKDHWLDGALVAFHNDNSTSWRLSFVKVEYKYSENGKPIEELTPAKRYSFLVGEGEPSHTAQMQLAKIYELTSQNPTLAQLEEAFSVEKVTKEFFDKYRDLFESVVAELKSSQTFQNESSKNNIDTESFAKKLLGQIVFLYFLQKKGWLGVPKGKSWGEGDKMFLRNIYNQAISENKNFFNNYLEVLFYDTLNNARNDKVDRNYSDFFQSKVPFLNGGLFEPQYDWKNSLMFLDNKLFDKILGVFDTYNFTVKEDEPLEKEVAVDPEMLGKVFENLLEENLRKGKGTYYTPREIVHYMCEESLINFLATETELSPDDLKSKYFPAYNKLGDEKLEVRDVSVSEKIIESLKDIKVVDPACGSGAFLVGMLQQITQLRNDLETRSKLLGRRDNASTEYEIKKQTIQNCIYGVDIDPGAIDIAKLRLWLSLVVDYDLEEIEPLPNLDYKLMQGNSLLEELVLGDTSIKLYDSEGIKKVMGSKRMKNLFDKENQIGLFDGDNDKVMKSLKSLQLKYFSTSDSESKKEIRNKIEKIEHELIETSVKSSLDDLRNQKQNVRVMPGIGILPEDVKRLEKISSKESQIFAVLNELNKTGTKPFFLWHLYFSDVFKEKGGFDILIGNPPYVNSKKIEKTVRDIYWKLFKEVLSGDMDLYQLFFVVGINLLHQKGVLSLVTSDSYLTNQSFKLLRDFILENSRIISIHDFPHRFFPFKSVNTETSFIILVKQQNNQLKQTIGVSICDKKKMKIDLGLDRKIVVPLFDKYNGFFLGITDLTSRIIKVNEDKSISFSDSFIVSNPSSLDRKERHPKTSLKSYDKCIFTVEEVNEDVELSRIVEPCITGDKILRYLIHGEDLYTNISWMNKGVKKQINNETYSLMKSSKLIGQRITGQAKWRIVFTYDDTGLITMPSVNVVALKSASNDSGSLLNLLGVLNSRLYNYLYKDIFKENNTNITSDVFNIIPIPQIAIESNELRLKVLEILKTGYTKELDDEIDKLVYSLYGLTEKETNSVVLD
jgi:hypothetical protein